MTGGVRGGDEVDPRDRDATRRRAGVVGGVGVGESPALGGGVGAGGGLTPGTAWGVGEQRRESLRMMGRGAGGCPGWRGALSHAGATTPPTCISSSNTITSPLASPPTV